MSFEDMHTRASQIMLNLNFVILSRLFMTCILC